MQDGCLIGSIYNDEDVCILGDADTKYIVFEDGAQFKYDKTTSTCTVTASNINITGNVTVDGNLTPSGDITDETSSMQDMRDVYNSHTHTCPDGTTSTPANSM